MNAPLRKLDQHSRLPTRSDACAYGAALLVSGMWHNGRLSQVRPRLCPRNLHCRLEHAAWNKIGVAVSA